MNPDTYAVLCIMAGLLLAIATLFIDALNNGWWMP